MSEPGEGQASKITELESARAARSRLRLCAERDAALAEVERLRTTRAAERDVIEAAKVWHARVASIAFHGNLAGHEIRLYDTVGALYEVDALAAQPEAGEP